MSAADYEFPVFQWHYLRGRFHPMTTFTVQYTLPVDNPVSKVSVRRQKAHMVFDVPINHPDAHRMGLMDLIAAAELSGLITVSPTPNNKTLLSKKHSSRVEEA